MAARQILTRTTVVGPYPSLQPTADSLDVTFTACDAVNFDEFVMSGNDVLLVWNSDGANPYTFTLESVADDLQRTGDVTTYSLAAGEIGAFKFNKKAGWMQTSGECHIKGSNAAIKFAVLVL